MNHYKGSVTFSNTARRGRELLSSRTQNTANSNQPRASARPITVVCIICTLRRLIVFYVRLCLRDSALSSAVFDACEVSAAQRLTSQGRAPFSRENASNGALYRRKRRWGALRALTFRLNAARCHPETWLLLRPLADSNGITMCARTCEAHAHAYNYKNTRSSLIKSYVY